MCYGAEAGWVPAVVAGLSAAATGAGTYSAAKANKIQIEEQDNARRADQFRQAELQRQADSKLRDQLTTFEPASVEQRVAQAADTRAAGAQPPAVAPAQYQSTTAAAPVEVKTDLDRRLAGVTAKAKDEAGRRARLAAYGDVSADQSFEMNRLGEAFRQMQANSRGSTNVMRAQASLPATGATGWQNRSDIANTIGSIGSLYATRGRKSSDPFAINWNLESGM